MNKHDKKLIQDMQGQWLFVVLGLLLAGFLGIIVNALYDLLTVNWSPLKIVSFFGLLALVLVDMFSHMFDHLKEIREGVIKSQSALLRDYAKYRAKSLMFWK